METEKIPPDKKNMHHQIFRTPWYVPELHTMKLEIALNENHEKDKIIFTLFCARRKREVYEFLRKIKISATLPAVQEEDRYMSFSMQDF